MCHPTPRATQLLVDGVSSSPLPTTLAVLTRGSCRQVTGRPGTMLLDLYGSGKKKKAAAYQPDSMLPGIDLCNMLPDTPTSMTVPLKREGKRGTHAGTPPAPRPQFCAAVLRD